MRDFDPATSFGAAVARDYDDHPRGDEADAVAFLAGLADGAALEFAVGTGRIALPLSATGVRVDGIELSPDMVARLREKPGGDRIDVTMGDMSTVVTGRRYPLVYLVFNTIGNLLTQDGQVECFRNAARHLAPGGAFVLECLVPSAPGVPGRQRVEVERLELDRVGLDVWRYDPVTQILDENHVSVTAEGVRFAPIRKRLAHPPEFDLMARLAGLRLDERFGGWRGEPFTADSRLHVSVYRAG